VAGSVKQKKQKKGAGFVDDAMRTTGKVVKKAKKIAKKAQPIVEAAAPVVKRVVKRQGSTSQARHGRLLR